VVRALAFLAAAATLAIGPATLDPCFGDAVANAASRCCKVCTKGKACGNSCIAAWKNCHQPKGCACNG